MDRGVTSSPSNSTTERSPSTNSGLPDDIMATSGSVFIRRVHLPQRQRTAAHIPCAQRCAAGRNPEKRIRPKSHAPVGNAMNTVSFCMREHCCQLKPQWRPVQHMHDLVTSLQTIVLHDSHGMMRISGCGSSGSHFPASTARHAHIRQTLSFFAHLVFSISKLFRVAIAELAGSPTTAPRTSSSLSALQRTQNLPRHTP